MADTTKTLRGISEIRGFFRSNRTPIYFVSPTAFNLLGIDRWVRNFFFVNYFDSFEGRHPRVFVPPAGAHPEFESIEDICNYLLTNDDALGSCATAAGARRRCSCSSTRRPSAARPTPVSTSRCPATSCASASTRRS